MSHNGRVWLTTASDVHFHISQSPVVFKGTGKADVLLGFQMKLLVRTELAENLLKENSNSL